MSAWRCWCWGPGLSLLSWKVVPNLSWISHLLPRPWPMLCSTTTPSPSSNSLVHMRPSFAFLKVFLFHEISFLPSIGLGLQSSHLQLWGAVWCCPSPGPAKPISEEMCRSVRRVDAPVAAVLEALEQIEDRLQANKEAAAEAARMWTGSFQQNHCYILF